MIKSPGKHEQPGPFYCLNSVHDTTEFRLSVKATPSAADIYHTAALRGEYHAVRKHFAVILR